MPEQNLVFPDISDIIYGERESVRHINERHIARLEKTGDQYNIAYANKLRGAQHMSKEENVQEFYRNYLDFKYFMLSLAEKCRVKIEIITRKKNYLRFNSKVRSKLVKNEILADVNDLFGIRAIIGDWKFDSIAKVELCYLFFEEGMNFLMKECHMLPHKAEPRTEDGFVQKNYPNIIVPEKQLLNDFFIKNSKDYILNPKKKGYQSLHAVLEKDDGLVFELQVRTSAMDLHAIEGDASHLEYEESRKKPWDIILDYSKIQIPGFEYDKEKNQIIKDEIGLVLSIDPFANLNLS